MIFISQKREKRCEVCGKILKKDSKEDRCESCQVTYERMYGNYKRVLAF